MNITELARKLRINTKELLEILPEHGFDIGKKAIKIDDRVADQVMRKWRYIKRELEKKQAQEFEERKLKERELRKQMGKTVSVPNFITVKDFAAKLEMSVTQIITELMKNGILANQNQDIDYDTASIIAEELGFTTQKEENKVDIEKEVAISQEVEQVLAQAKDLQVRPPVVVVMGHVDHGKTSLLDTVRKAHIIDTESGGITQHIGAYQTIWKDPKTQAERLMTFIDTPGHEAFTVMRSRGATIADIAILVVAADDGVKPQTEEVIQIIKAAKLPFVVAINKIDKENIDIQRVKTELSQKNIISEEWGGDVPMVEISAKNNINIDKLLDVLLLVADMNEDSIKADPTLPVVGTVIESHTDKHMGPVATVLIQAGTLKKGDPLIMNNEVYGKVRAMRDYLGKNMDLAGPSVPAQIIGFKVAPEVGDILDLSKESTAQMIDVKQKQSEMTSAYRQPHIDIQNQDEDSEEKKKTLNLVIKADVLGSLEAIIGSLERLKHDEVGVRIIGKGLGNINESDLQKVEAMGGTLIGFHVKPTPSAEVSINEKSLEYKNFEVIYHLMDWVKDELEKLLSTEKIVEEIGTMEVKAVFRTEKKMQILGGVVKDGKILPHSKLRIIRDGQQIDIGKILKCQVGQSKVKELPQGTEGGIQYEGKTRIEVGDILEVYTEESKAKKLELEVTK
ncbi:MAG: translation initiation factor IF-2 [Candidatus Magasanikbacteria bacterium CG11_big_fil_rev_8_21_14_0_20_39_34]|uniref:Translation initiation factor IF-2 n=1 Tax=Candidatus Magasanikbacteria bacterium CG11_big_fil_rev_8_21_14_0_20_39_34 TaxID=1974653 RepID=A0A2H0N4W9_9BACT|nr:MAG: translation initiation factor IF-2 [Candidatus Magasanikbacteria bacterium CG11_big_fil_rev_8_21_14_0_20_39_34]